MKSFFLVLLALLAMPGVAQQMKDMYPRWTKAQKYAAEGFEPLDCFGGQARVRGKRIVRQTFSVFAPNSDMRCCGEVIKTARTDEHGHFLAEPMAEGKYFAEFEFKGVQHITSFAIIDSYQRCDGTHVEVEFSDANKAKIGSFVDIDDSGEPCRESEPRCYRK